MRELIRYLLKDTEVTIGSVRLTGSAVFFLFVLMVTALALYGGEVFGLIGKMLERL